MIDDDALVRARALSDPTRVAILRLVRAADQPVTAAELARPIGIHHTAVRQHLAKLIDASLVARATLPPAGRGRPRVGYTATATASADDHYQALAIMLAEAVSTGQSARETGRQVALRRTVAHGDPVEALLSEAQRLGFDPVVGRQGSSDTVDIVLQTCPFAELADADPATVCQLHLGLAEGLAEMVGGVVIEGLHLADPHLGGCRLTVRRPRA